MISALLSFFGITLLYTAFLASPHHATTAILAACAGLLLLLRPAMDALKLLRAHRGPTSRPAPRAKKPTKKIYLKIVKSEDEKPTIH